MKTPLIVEICPCYVNLDGETGGVANIVREICHQLALSRRRVLLLCANTELGDVVARPERRRSNDYLTVQVFAQRPHPMLGPIGSLAAELRGLPADCVAHVHTCFSAFTESAMAVLSRRGIPFVFTPHGKLSAHMLRKRSMSKRMWWWTVARRYVLRAGAIAVSGSGEAGPFPSLGLGQPSVVIPNGYAAPTVGTTEVPAVDGPYVLFLGYLDPRKQPEFLVRAFARSKSCVTHRLVIAGPDAYGHEAIVRRTIEASGIAGRVSVLGPKYAREKWNLLCHAACLCLPSRGEGLPVVMCEALGAGIPIVYSTACNFPEVGANNAGIELEGFSEAAWAQAIDKVCLDASVQVNLRAATRRMGSDYSWERIVRRWCRLYDAIRGDRVLPLVVHGIQRDA